jgi:hypothetical protein
VSLSPLDEVASGAYIEGHEVVDAGLNSLQRGLVLQGSSYGRDRRH